ncbi:MAG: hypothetical protein KDD51_06015 [Bdellovibrionales bacterium]|nr:hypothetical protein [Bdellovibrionales bacterium]
MDLSSLQLLLLPGKVFEKNHLIPEYEALYRFWKRFWTHVYSEANSEAHFNLDDFLRQDIICVVLYRGNVAGCLCHSYFGVNRESSRDHSYFRFFSPYFLKTLNQHNISVVQTFEFLSIDPLWRQRNTHLALAEILIGCGLKVLQHSFADAAIAIARRDVNVHGKAHKMGYWSVEEEIVKRNFSCDTIVCLRTGVKPHPDAQTLQITEQIWEQRLNATAFSALDPIESDTSYNKINQWRRAK